MTTSAPLVFTSTTNIASLVSSVTHRATAAASQSPRRSKMDMNDLANRFRYHAPNESKAGRHTLIRQKCFELAVELNSLLPDGREKSLAITNLEDVMFWSNASIARHRFDEDDYSVKK